ncbi:MAG: hypothetical protein IH796_10880 [Deltaproteobacteria bacterium]|nr:hypothetical protein [Deltaproteobacteria bacterium]
MPDPTEPESVPVSHPLLAEDRYHQPLVEDWHSSNWANLTPTGKDWPVVTSGWSV